MVTKEMGAGARSIYEELLVPMNPGDFLEHSRLTSHGTYADFNTARRRLLRDKGRALKNRRGQGYEMVAAAGHWQLSDEKVERGRRQLRGGGKLLDEAVKQHPNELTVAQIKDFEARSEVLKQHNRRLRRLEEEQAITNAALKSVETSANSRLAELEKRIIQIEQVGVLKAA